MAETTGRNIEFPIKNADGSAFHNLVLRKATVDSVVMSLGDKITGDVYYVDNTLTVTMQEYIEYNGVRYVLVNPPTVVREGMVSDNSGLNGMTKYSFEFYHPMYMLGNFPFTDIAVKDDEEQYLAQNKTFSWIGTGLDFIAKLNANLRGTEWVVVASDNEQSLAKLQCLPNDVVHTKSEDNTTNGVLTFDQVFISDALKTMYDTWEVPFVIDRLQAGEYYDEHSVDYYSQGKKFVIVVGLPSNEIHGSKEITVNVDTYIGEGVYSSNTLIHVNAGDVVNVTSYTAGVPLILDSNHQEITMSFPYTFAEEQNVYIGSGGNSTSITTIRLTGIYVFEFGKGVGLKNNSRTPKNNKIITRIAPIGSENNIPYGYPQIVWLGNPTWNFTGGLDAGTGIKRNVTIAQGITIAKMISYPIYDGILGGRRVKLIKHPFTRTTLMPSVYGESVNNKVNPLAMSGSTLIANPTYDCDAPIIDYYDAGSGFPHPIVQEAPSFEAHQFGDIKPELGEARILDAYIGNALTDDIQSLIKSDVGKIPTKYPALYAAEPQIGEYLEKFKSAGTEQWQPMENIAAFRTWLYQAYLASNAMREVSASDKYYLQYMYDALGEGRYTFTENQSGANPLFGMSIRGDYFIYISYHSSNYINWDFYVWNEGVSQTGVWDDTIGDDGNYVQSNFYLKLPQLSFDLYASAAITQEMQINMRSGACMGCTFVVQVDWELYKKNFYRADGTFDPDPHVSADDEHVRDLSKFPDSRQGSIDILVQKDNNTFGKLMPNQYQNPKGESEEGANDGDQFVVLGISLPTEYITNAEARLDDAADQYMLENNVYHYEYPLKFDEYFLATHNDILAQMRNNTIVRFKYAGLENVLYIKQITVKYGDNVLPQYDITLTDDVEIVLNQIGQVTDDVSRVRVQMNELQKYYGEDVVKQINEKLSRVADDVALGRITFQQGINVIGDTIFNGALQTPNFAQGLYEGSGWKIDALGNAELESLRVRSFLEVIELLVNRMQAQEGDTMFTDNDQIDFVEKIEYNNIDYYLLTLKEKWEGYITSQQEGNIIRGMINTLAAKNAGVSDVTAEQSVEIDGQNKYFTSWMLMVNVPSGMDVTLGDNQILVVLYGDNETPAQKNFEPCELMTIVRWGCVKDPNEQGISNAEKESRRRRQNSFCISASEGRFMRLVGVNSPTLNNGNYGSTLGELPDFVKAYPSVAARLVEGGDYLYAQGIVVESFIKIDKQGLPIINYVDKGDWATNTTYLVNEYNSNTLQYETHDVWHNGAYWRCRMHQPVSGVYYEPTEDSPYWEKLLRSGADGEDATLVTLVPNPSTVNFAWVNGAYTPSSISLRCGFVITEGDNSTSYVGNVNDYTTLYNKLQYRAYVRTKRSDGTYGNWVAWGISTIALNPQSTTTNLGYEFALSTATDVSSVSDSNIVTRVVVPIVKSGEKGNMSRNIYFAGLWSDLINNTFEATDYKAPYVRVGGTDENPICYSYIGANGTGIAYPASQAAYQSSSDWEIMYSDFKYLITQAIFAALAKLGSWIFNGDYMFSQHGIKNGQDSTSYEEFEGNEDDTFQPNLYMNALTGRIVANDIVLRGVLNNMVQVINSDNKANYGYYESVNCFYINPLKVGQYVFYDMSTPIFLPVANGDGNDNTYIFGLKDVGVDFTLNEMRQMVGKKIYFLPNINQLLHFQADFALLMEMTTVYGGSGGTNDIGTFVSQGGIGEVVKEANVTDDIVTSGTKLFYIAECKTGRYNGRECIYWEVEAKGDILT